LSVLGLHLDRYLLGLTLLGRHMMTVAKGLLGNEF
jgi:hypothetical protein